MMKPTSALPIGLARALGLLGLGMLVWACVSTALLQGRGDAFLNLRPMQNRALGSGLLLSALLLVPLWPQAQAAATRLWRPRALAALALTLAADAALLVLLNLQTHSPGLIAIAGALACICALATMWMAAQAMDTPSSPWHVPAQSALALLAGAVLFFATMAWMWPTQMASGGVPSLVLLGVVAAGLLLASWLGEGRAAVLPVRQHWPRWSMLAVLVLVPLLLAAVLALQPRLQKPVWCLAVLATVGVILIEGQGHRFVAPARNSA